MLTDREVQDIRDRAIANEIAARYEDLPRVLDGTRVRAWLGDLARERRAEIGDRTPHEERPR